MALTPDQMALVLNLRRVRSPVKRMQVLAGAWRSFRGLSAADRREVASQLGLKGFERLAGLIGEKGGLAPGELEELLEQVESVEPSKAAALIARLGDPEGRRELARRGVAALGARLAAAGEEAADADEDDGGTENAREDALPAARADPEEGIEAPPAPSMARHGSGTVRDAPAPVPASGEPAAGEATHEEPPDSMPSMVVGAGSSRAAREAATPVEPDRLSEEVRSAIQRIEFLSSPIRRLRCLRAVIATCEPLTGVEVHALVELFQEGWLRRRALTALLLSGSPCSFDEALAAAMELPGASGRRWGLAALARGRSLETEDLDRLTEAAGSRVLARSLKRLQSARDCKAAAEGHSGMGGAAGSA